MARELGDDMGYLSWKKAGVNPYGLAIIANRDFLASHRDTVAQFTKHHAARLCSSARRRRSRASMRS